MLFSYGQAGSTLALLLELPIRAALGLHNGLTLNAVALGTVARMPRLYLASPIPAAAWQDLWRLKATFVDGPGLVESLAYFLKSEGIVVFATRCTTGDYGDAFRVEMDLDLTAYSSPYDGTSATRRANPLIPLTGLKTKLAMHFARQLFFLAPGEAQLSLLRNVVLYRAARLQAGCVELQVQAGKIGIHELPGVAAGHLPDAVASEVAWYCVADEEHCALYLYQTAHHDIMHVRFDCRSQLNTLPRLARELRRKPFNILQSYLRPSGRGNRCLIDLLVHWRPRAGNGTGGTIAGELQRVCDRLAKPLDCRLFVPRVRGCHLAETSAAEV